MWSLILILSLFLRCHRSEYKTRHPFQPTHVPLSAAENGLRKDSIALCENPMTIPKDALQEYRTHLTGEALSRIRVGMIASMALLSGLDLPTVNKAAEMSSRLSSIC